MTGHSQLVALVGRASLSAVDLVQQAGAIGGIGPLGFLPEWPKMDVQVEQQIKVPEAPADQSACLLEFTISWRPIGDDSDGAPTAQMKFSFRLMYSFSGSPPSRDAFEQLASNLGVHHAWPFLRERVRTFAADLSLPPTVLPLRRLTGVLKHCIDKQPSGSGAASALDEPEQ